MANEMSDFKVMFKCLSGFTTESGKFIMPLQEKLSYENSVDLCDSFGFKKPFLWVITRSVKKEAIDVWHE